MLGVPVRIVPCHHAITALTLTVDPRRLLTVPAVASFETNWSYLKQEHFFKFDCHGFESTSAARTDTVSYYDLLWCLSSTPPPSPVAMCWRPPHAIYCVNISHHALPILFVDPPPGTVNIASRHAIKGTTGRHSLVDLCNHAGPVVNIFLIAQPLANGRCRGMTSVAHGLVPAAGDTWPGNNTDPSSPMWKGVRDT